MSQRKRYYLVAYDISDTKRLGRVYRCMKNWGIPAQYSLFLVWNTRTRLDKLVAELADIIHDKEDDVRIYPVPAHPEAVKLGEQRFDGMLIHNGAESLQQLFEPMQKMPLEELEKRLFKE